MKKAILALLLVVALFTFTIASVSAGGDMVRGDKGTGQVNQVQVASPPPFQP